MLRAYTSADLVYPAHWATGRATQRKIVQPRPNIAYGVVFGSDDHGKTPATKRALKDNHLFLYFEAAADEGQESAVAATPRVLHKKNASAPWLCRALLHLTAHRQRHA